MQEAEWIPRTKLGKQVAAKEIQSIEEIFEKGLVVKEPEIVDMLLPDLGEEVIAIGKAGRPFKMVQRMTDSGRRNNFQVIVAIGNEDGYVGLGEGRAKEYGPSLRKALKDAKLSIIRIPRGCGSWQCSCGAPHSLPFQVEGHAGSVKIRLKPAPKGIGLVASKTSKAILRLAGYSDIWVKSSGNTSARVNLAKATFDALINLNRMKAAELKKYYKTKSLAEEVEKLRDSAPSQGTPSKDKPSQGKSSKDKPSQGTPSKDKPSQGKSSPDKPSKDKPSKDKSSQGKSPPDKPSKDKSSQGKPPKDQPPSDQSSPDPAPKSPPAKEDVAELKRRKTKEKDDSNS